MFHVLIALADQERHGYAIIKDVAHRTAGHVVVEPEAGRSADVASAIRGAVRALRPDLVVARPEPLLALITRRMGALPFGAWLLGLVAALAVGLSAKSAEPPRSIPLSRFAPSRLLCPFALCPISDAPETARRRSRPCSPTRRP
jgi:hypothetical protein